MNKRFLKYLIAAFTSLLLLSSCNKGLTDFHYKFNYAKIYFGNELVVEGEVEKWWDYEGSDMIQVQIDGKVYMTHSSCVLFIG